MLSGGGQGQSLLAACGGDTVKIFDVSAETGDPCTFHYTPSHSSQVHCAKWNHTNLVVASAGDDRRISLWMKNGQSVGVLPQPGNDSGDSVDESILSICFSNKGSRYLCSGGTGKVVRVWDLQRKRCIKWLKGHTETITGVMYNCKDEHLASISLRGDLILHSLASGTRTTELRDPHDQVLRVLDYSRTSRHILATAGDDGSLHLWDTTSRSPKVSWLKQHSAPTTGVSFSPSNDKLIISVGLDKKLYSFDSGMKKPTFCIPCEAPFSSLAFKDDGLIIAAGTNSGRVVFYDVRGKPQPFTILRAYSSSEAVTSLCWQWSKPIIVKDTNWSADTALLGGATEDSILMPDPLPPAANASNSSTSSTFATVRTSGRHVFNGIDTSPISATGISGASTRISAGDESLPANHLSTNGSMSRLQTRHNFSFKDDMDVFSPLVDVQPITPSVSSFWDGKEDGRKDSGTSENSRKQPWSTSLPSLSRRLSSTDEFNPELYALLKTPAKKEDSQNKVSSESVTPQPLIPTKIDKSPSVTPPEAWGGDLPSDRYNLRNQSQNALRLSASGPLDTSDILSDNANVDNASATDGLYPAYSKGIMPQLSSDASTLLPAELASRYMTYVGRKANSSLSKGELTLPSVVSPKQKKTGTEKKEEKPWPDISVEGKKELDHSTFLKSDTTPSMLRTPLLANGTPQTSSQRNILQPDMNQGPPSFALQLVQRTLEESLDSVQKAIHEDVQNLHLELLRQFHIQQTELGSMMNSLLSKQSELIEEVQALRKENEQLRQLL